MPLLANELANYLQNMQQHYHFETMNMIYEMVHKEGKSIIDIAVLFCTNTERISSIYQAALLYNGMVQKPTCVPVQALNISPVKYAANAR